MKKIKYVYIVTGLMLFGILLSAVMSVSLAWRNGASGTIKFGDPIARYYMDYKNPSDTIRSYYGTHDWVAESALELLHDVKSGNEFLNRLWGDPITNHMLRIYYLYGSELPDVTALPPGFKTDCGSFILSQFHGGRHNIIRFNDDESISDDVAARVADMLFHEIVTAFEKGDCQAAAAFLGAIVHVITDATFYAHVLPDVHRETPYSSHVLYTTYKKWTDGTRRYPIGNEFFTVIEARNSITALDWGSPYIATVLAAKDTRFGWVPDNPNGFQTARWMSTREAYWDSVKGFIGTDYNRQLSWDYSDRPDSNNEITKYFNTVEHNLNTAIIYSAAAINFVLEYGGYKDCSCIGDWPPQDDGQGQGQRDRSDLKIQVDEFTGLFFFNMAGLFATGIAVVLLSKMNILKELKIPV